MGRLRARLAALHALVRRMDRQSLDAAGAGGDLRPLHHEVLLPLRLVPQRAYVPAEQGLQDRIRMGKRHHLRHGRGFAGAYLRLPDVRHPDLVDGKVAADRRLSLCEQGDLRTADAQHAAVVPVRASHDALLADQKSFSEAVKWPYHRLKGLRKIKRNDVVVFNFPAGDTVLLENQNATYYDVLRSYEDSFGKEEGRKRLAENTPSSAAPWTNGRITSNAAWPFRATRSKYATGRCG